MHLLHTRLLGIWMRNGELSTPAEQRAFLLGCAAVEQDQAWVQKHHSRAGSRKHTAALARMAAIDAVLLELRALPREA